MVPVTFTGHRADFFIFAYDEAEELYKMIKREMVKSDTLALMKKIYRNESTQSNEVKIK